MKYKEILPSPKQAFGYAALMLGAFGIESQCNDPEGARKILENAGLQSVETFDQHGWGDCGLYNAYTTRFKAVTPNGRQISGTVCENLFKNISSIHLD